MLPVLANVCWGKVGVMRFHILLVSVLRKEVYLTSLVLRRTRTYARWVCDPPLEWHQMKTRSYLKLRNFFIGCEKAYSVLKKVLIEGMFYEICLRE